MSLILDGTSGITSPAIPAAGAIGGTTPAAGAFTTLSASGQTTLTGGVNLTSVVGTSYEKGSWTPVVTSGTGSITTVGAVGGTYIKVGSLVVARFNIIITNNGTGATFLNFAGLPYVAAGTTTGCGYESVNTGKLIELRLLDTATSLQAYYYDATYPGVSGGTYFGSVTYITA